MMDAPSRLSDDGLTSMKPMSNRFFPRRMSPRLVISSSSCGWPREIARGAGGLVEAGAEAEVLKAFILELDDDLPCAGGCADFNDPLCIAAVEGLNFFAVGTEKMISVVIIRHHRAELTT